ncbi:MAG: hypothetical protein C0490_16165, partial [Marivirga sp.]|nr:hypothetical protein [Marivirga sp.]
MKNYFTVKPNCWTVMRHFTLQAMIAAILCGVAFAHTNYAQLLEKKVTLDLKEVPLAKALKEIEAITQVRFFYSIDQLELKEKITVKVADKPLRELLDEMLSPHHIRYKVHENESTITLKKKWDPDDNEAAATKPGEKIGNDKPTPPILTGNVRDGNTGQPMPGVNVVIRGTTVGTTTDSEGKFTIEAEDKDILVFSFIGYATVEVQVSGKTVIDITLIEDIKSLKE